MSRRRKISGAEIVVTKLEKDLVALRKQTEDVPALTDQMSGIKSYIERAEKRVTASAKALEDAQVNHVKFQEDLDAHRTQLEK